MTDSASLSKPRPGRPELAPMAWMRLTGTVQGGLSHAHSPHGVNLKVSLGGLGRPRKGPAGIADKNLKMAGDVLFGPFGCVQITKVHKSMA